MLYTYPEHERSWPENPLLRRLAKIYVYVAKALFGAFFMLVLILFLGVAFSTLPLATALLIGAGTALALSFAAHRLSAQCRVIRLRDDGTCEFETRRGVVRAQVTQITSVEEGIDEDGDAHYYLRFRDRRTLWTCRLRDFEDFLTRIKTMNPTIDIERHESWRRRRR